MTEVSPPAPSLFARVMLEGAAGELGVPVESVHGDVVRFRAGNDSSGRLSMPEVGRRVTVTWPTPDGLAAEADGVVRLADRAAASFAVRLGEPRRVQRREAVRAQLDGEVVLTMGRASTVAPLCDLSETGLRCLVPIEWIPELTAGTVLRVSVRLAGRDDLEADAEVARATAPVDWRNPVALRFAGLPERSADALRASVFAALARQRRAIRAG